MKPHMIFVALVAIAAHAQTFEVASVRPHPPAVDQPLFKNPDLDPVHITGNQVMLEMVSLKQLVMAAYGVKEYQVSGGPAWASRIDALYDIRAKTPGDGASDPAQVRLMLESLLAERFHLKLRREAEQLPVYNLAVAKGGPKLQPASGAAPRPGMRRGSMDQLVALLSVMLDRPVIDKTGLPGIFDYSSELARLDEGARDPADAQGRVLQAIRDRLGLRVEAARATTEMLMIESADQPSQN